MYAFVILSCCTIIFLTILFYGPYVVALSKMYDLLCCGSHCSGTCNFFKVGPQHAVEYYVWIHFGVLTNLSAQLPSYYLIIILKMKSKYIFDRVFYMKTVYKYSSLTGRTTNQWFPYWWDFYLCEPSLACKKSRFSANVLELFLKN